MNPLSAYRIITPAHPVPGETRAALFLRNAIRIVTGVMLPLDDDGATPIPTELCVGRTNRLDRDGITIPALPLGRHEYTLRTVGERLHFCGNGCPEDEPVPAISAYRYYDDGSFGTVCAVYRFVEEVLGWPFLHAAPAPTDPNCAIPDGYDGSYTRALLRAAPIPDVEGTALYMLPVTGRLDWNLNSFIFRTKSGKLVVMDGGHPEEREYLLATLRTLSPDPARIRVEAWLFTHLHVDHYGALRDILRDESLIGQLEIGAFYHHLLPGEYYANECREKQAGAPEVVSDLTSLPCRFGATVQSVEDGDVIAVDELRFHTLHTPKLADGAEMNTNDTSVVWRLDVEGGRSVLFLADAEFVCSRHLLAQPNALRADIVQVGHHGCGNVSARVYAATGATRYLWPVGHKFRYSDRGDGLGTHNTGVIQTRAYLDALGVPPEAHIYDDHGIVGISLN